MDQIQRLFNFIAAAPTAFHAAAAAAERLAAAGFAELREDGPWDLRPGGACFLTRNGASLIAFRLPAERPEGFRIAASHSDSPAFRLKRGGAFARKGYCLLGTEPYGGGIYSTWADRPLSVAGRLLVREGTALRTRLVDLDGEWTCPVGGAGASRAELEPRSRRWGGVEPLDAGPARPWDRPVGALPA